MLTANYAAAKNIARIVKTIDSGIEVAVGGAHVRLDTEGVMATSEFDYGVSGEGELTMMELVSLFKEFYGKMVPIWLARVATNCTPSLQGHGIYTTLRRAVGIHR